ncbi:MAG: hypothetical protein KF752_11730 [Pirellulaceae bacterium]|nr:hypothetical protein [Pirellulaceae bacterium]
MQDLILSKRLLAMIASVLAVALKDTLPLTEQQITDIVMVVAAWIIGDSIRKTDKKGERQSEMLTVENVAGIPKLPFRQRKLARKLASECYTTSATDADRQKLFGQRLQAYGFDPLTIAMMLAYAIKLWLWWKEQKAKDPGHAPMRGEPQE